jgi:predicted lipoprotein with Yx(FWY)xxD motif
MLYHWVEPTTEGARMKHAWIVAVVLAASVAALAPQAFAARSAHMGPVIKLSTKKFGPVLATPHHLALYTWKQEQAGKVRCTGACAKAWPPLLVMKGEMVEKHVAGIMGTFGQIRRPDGHMQVTFNRHALYTYHADTATKILCNGVDGWFVVRLAH